MKRIVFFILALITGIQLYSQERMVSGTVQDETGEALIGVTISIKGTAQGSITDVNGQFSISVSDPNQYLVISYIGYQTQTMKAGTQTNLSLVMLPDYAELEEVVVTGYGSQKKINLTGAVENVAVDDLETRSLTNTGLALQGKVAGVQVTQSSGQPGQDNAEIRIRGISSIENNNDPLVIIDGIEGNLEDVHPRNIESMTVLKDASSAAIYGNRAAAGVIIITTKQGTGGLTISVSAVGSVQEATATPQTVDGYTYALLLNEARFNSGYPTPAYDEEHLERLREGKDPRYQTLDLYDLYFRPAFMQNYFATVSGGEKNYNFAFSLGYLDQEGVLYGTSADKFTYRANLNSKFANEKLRVGISFSGYNKNEEELSSSTPSVMTSLANSSPIGFVQAVDTITGEPTGLYGAKAKYIAFQENGGGIFRNRDNFNYRLFAEMDIVKGMTAKVLYGQTIYKYQYTRLLPSVALAGDIYADDEVSQITQSQLQKTSSNTISSTFTSTLDYSRTFDNHELHFLGGFEYLNYHFDSDDSEIKDLLANQPSFTFGDPETRFLSSQIKERATMSYFGRFNYALMGRYLIEGNIRRDGSSRFAEGNRWGTFPSISAGWRISEEPFMQSLGFLYLKVRASWGKLGNEKISEYYPAYDVLEVGQYYSFGGEIYQGTGTTLLANKDVSWEVTEQTNIGVDATLFQHYSLSFNYFNKITTDILGRMDIPLSLGLGSTSASKPYQNIGTMRNNGVEFTLGYNNIWKNWNFQGNINLTYIHNEIIDLGGLDYITHDVISGYLPPAGIIRSHIGYPFGSYFGLIADGIYQVDDFTWQNESDPDIPHYDRFYSLKPELADPSAILRGAVPGDIKFKDISGPEGVKDNKISNEDITYMGNSQPKYIYAVNLRGGYKNLSLNILAQGTYGANAYIMGAMITPFWGGRGNITQEMADMRWTYENPSETHQYLYDDSQRANIVSTYYLQDASYLRIKNIEIAYRLNNAFLTKKGIYEIGFSLSVENAFTITKLNGFDPEKSFNKITGDFHPQIRIYSFGINLKI